MVLQEDGAILYGDGNLYKSTLQSFMRLRWLAFVIIAVCVGIILFIGKQLPSELAPMEDRNRVRASITGPEGVDFDFTDRVAYEITQQLLDSIPEKHVVLHSSPDSMFPLTVESGPAAEAALLFVHSDRLYFVIRPALHPHQSPSAVVKDQLLSG